MLLINYLLLLLMFWGPSFVMQYFCSFQLCNRGREGLLPYFGCVFAVVWVLDFCVLSLVVLWTVSVAFPDHTHFM